MKNYIWERAYKRTWLSANYDIFNEGLINVATFIHLLGGEVRNILAGYTGDFNEKDKELLVMDKQVVPYIYFYYKNPPYYKYEKEPEVVERIAQEKGITIQHFLNLINLENVRDSAEEEYEKSPVTNDWQEWQKQNELLFEKIGSYVTEFNQNYKNEESLNYKVIIFDWNPEAGVLCISVTTNLVNLHDTQMALGLTQEKRQEINKISLEIFKDFGEFLKDKFIKE